MGATQYQQKWQLENKEYRTKYQKERGESYKALGKCKNHPEQDLPCKPCLKRNRKDRMIRQRGLICIRCAKIPPVSGKLSCFNCLLRTRLNALPQQARDAARRAVQEFDGRCESCGGDSPGGTEWCLDHNHKTGNFRGIICHWCNKALGHVDDSIKKLKSLIKYLRSNE